MGKDSNTDRLQQSKNARNKEKTVERADKYDIIKNLALWSQYNLKKTF